MFRIGRLLHNLFRRSRVERELNEELRSYLDLSTDQKMAEGMNEREARREAQLELGGIAQVKEAIRDAKMGITLQQVWQDVRYGARVLRRAPGFSIATILVLALAIGFNTAVFSVIEGVLLRPLPYHDAQRLYVLWKTVPQRSIESDWTSYPTIRDWREQTDVFADLTIVLRPEGSRVVLESDTGRERIQGSKVSGNFFDVLGVQPFLGRTFSPEEARRGENVVVLSYGFWQQRLGGTSAAVGQTLRIDERNTTIIGVMPPSFQLPDKNAQAWLLLSADSRWSAFQRFRIADAFHALGRLKPGVSMEEAQAEMNAISARLAQEYPATDADLGVLVVPLSDQIAGRQVRHALWTLGAVVLCVLLIACSNIASLFVARSVARRRELAVRAALGAGRGRLLAQLTSESVLLSLAGGIGGVLIAHAGLHSLLALAPPDLPRSDGIGINGVVLGFNFSLCLITGLFFGLLPAGQIASVDPSASLSEGGRSGSAGPGVHRLRGLLVSMQFALAFVLLTGGGLLIRSFLLLNAVPRGFDTTGLLTMSIHLPPDRYNDERRARVFFDESIRQIEALAGVRGAAVGSAVVDSLRGDVPNQNIVVEGRPFTIDSQRHARVIVSDGYFKVTGIPLREGRLFSSEDSSGRPRVAVINERLAAHLWPSESAVGKRFKEVLPGTDSPWMTVVGVVADVVYNRDGVPAPVFYAPLRQWFLNFQELAIRTEGAPLAMTAPIRRAVQSVDTSLPHFDIATVESRLEDLDRPRRFQTQLIGLFACIAVILATVGLYGLMAYTVEQRAKEIGIRLALGATSTNVGWLVLRQGLWWSILGIGVGSAGAYVFGQLLSAWLYGVSASDPTTLAIVVTVLGLTVMAASSIPILRASRVEPTVALRHD